MFRLVQRSSFFLILGLLVFGCGNENKFVGTQVSPITGTYRGLYSFNATQRGEMQVTIARQGQMNGLMTSENPPIGTATIRGYVNQQNYATWTYTFNGGDVFHMEGYFGETDDGLAGTFHQKEGENISISTGSLRKLVAEE